MGNETALTLRLLGDAASLRRALDQSRTGVTRFVTQARAEFGALKSAFNSVGGRLAGLGLGFSAAQQLGASAKLDKSITKVGQTAGATRGQVAGLRQEIFDMATQTGRPVEELLGGFENLVAAGQKWDEARATIRGVNVAMGVTGAAAQSLTSALTTAGATFDFDLSKPNLALELLDKMTVAGRQGNAELEDLSAVFSRIGPNAKAAGLGFDKTLAFVESLSHIEKSPERLATLADSTLRLFTNQQYAKKAQRATGVKFFDAQGARRDAEAVLLDFRAKFSKLTTDAEQAKFIQKAFGTVDLDTQKGLRTLLSGNTLDLLHEFTQEIANASGTLNHDLADAVDNGVDQLGRLSATLRKFTDWAAKPVTTAFDKAVKKLIDPKEKGGFGLSGGAILGAGVAATAAAAALGRYAPGIIGKLLRSGSGLATGVAQGKALEAAAGVTPVFVTNWPGSGAFGSGTPASGQWQEYLPGMGTGAASAGSKLGKLGMATAFGSLGVLLAGAGLAGYGWLKSFTEPGDPNHSINLGTGYGGWTSWDQQHAEAAHTAAQANEVKNTVNISLAVDKSGKVVAESNDRNTKVRIDTLNRGAFNPQGMRD
jgi:TP901 family phage tail tape measure protein